jgi:hypothetical protein
MHNELERIWKEVLVAWFMVLSQNLSGRTEEHNKKSVWIAIPQAKI